MGDFLLDFRPRRERQLAKAAELLRFTPQSQATVLDEPGFGLVLTETERLELWGPFKDQSGLLIAVAGRVALDEEQWRAGEEVRGTGGLASKALYQLYRNGGLGALEALGGNCVLFVHEPATGAFHFLTDPAGAFPIFGLDRAEALVFGSHPDVLAATTGEHDALDELSLTEFLLTSTVTPPFTYYRRIRAVDHGTVTTIKWAPGGRPEATRRRYFEMSLQADRQRSEAELAEELAEAFRAAVRRRTLPRLGRTAIALSGGLDSRALLACVENKSQVFSFCCYNERNRETETAESIAKAVQVPFLPWHRDFEYYARNAPAGVRISGGMGTFANNHFLGVVDRLRAEGAQNLLTGCYCDYLFKALPLNRKAHWLTGREEIAPFRHEFYFSHHLRPSPLAPQVRERLESRVPTDFQAQDSPEKVFQVEARRTFPLCYEGDNQQRVVPQRVTGWFLPVADRAILEVYRKIPSRYKLNRSVYLKAIRRLCNGPLARVPDANTGARVGASLFSECLHNTWVRARRKLHHSKPTIGTDGSWPNWQYYVGRSEQLRDLWKRPNPAAMDFFRRVLSPEDVRADTSAYQGRDIWLMVPMLTLKLWFEQWHSSGCERAETICCRREASAQAVA